MTKKEAIAYIKAIKNGLHETGKDFPYRDEIIPVAKEALDIAIKALEQEPCDDCISRQAVLDLYKKKGDDVWVGDIKNLPPVTPQSKMGRWVYDYTTADGHRTYHCSKCGCYLKPKHSEPLNSFKWCSLCGAKMQETEE